MSYYYKWSGPFHYLDTQDNPPYTCEFIDERDCSDGKSIYSDTKDFVWLEQLQIILTS
jgi:hypothetical protein